MQQNYKQPAVYLEQNLVSGTTATLGELTPVIVGGSYVLSRTGKETVEQVPYDSGSFTLPYTVAYDGGFVPLSSTAQVDLTSVGLTGTGMRAVLAEGLEFTVPSVADPSIIKIKDAIVSGFDQTLQLPETFRGRGMQVGDSVSVVYNNGNPMVRKVTGLIGVDVPSSFGSDANLTDKQVHVEPTSAQTNATSAISGTPTLPSSIASVVLNSPDSVDALAVLNAGAKVDNKLGDTFYFTVTQAGAPGTCAIDMTSASGKFKATNVVSADDSGKYKFSDVGITGFGFSVTAAGGVDSLPVGTTFSMTVLWKHTAITTANFTAAGTYTGSKDTTLIVEVQRTTSATTLELKVWDTVGVMTTRVLTATAGVPLAIPGLGVTLTLSSFGNTLANGMVAGDSVTLGCKAKSNSTTAFDKVILDGTSVDIGAVTTTENIPITVATFEEYTGDIDSVSTQSSELWVATEDGIKINGPLALYVPGRTAPYDYVAFATGYGTLSASFRALLQPADNEGLIPIYSVADIQANLGTIDPDNDIAYGASLMLQGSDTAGIYALRTGGSTLEDFKTAFKQAETNDQAYLFVPLTDDLTIQEFVRDHCIEASQPDVKMFRRAYAATEPPTSFVHMSKDAVGNTLTCSINGVGGVYDTLVTTNNVDFVASKVVAGDLVQIAGGSTMYPIAKVVSGTELKLATPYPIQVSNAVMAIIKTDSSDSQVTYVVDRSNALANRRICNIWTYGFKIDGTSTKNMYLAAYLAGVRAFEVPQQGLTRLELPSNFTCDAIMSKFTKRQLDTIAANGTFVITQDAQDKAAYVREQLTTDSTNGNLYQQDSTNVVADYVSKRIVARCNPYVGRYNATEEAVQRIEFDITEELEELKRTSTVNPDAGSTIVDYDSLTVAVDPIQTNQINVSVRIQIPTPIGSIYVTLTFTETLN